MVQMHLVGGRRTYQNPTPGGSPLWRFYRLIPVQNSVIVYKSGFVWEKAVFTDKQIADPEVDTYIQGGHDFYCESDSLAYSAMLEEGYTFQVVGALVGYLDEYTEEYT